MIRIILSLIFLVPSTARSEYRAYQYIVSSKDPYANATKADPQYVTSTLNPKMFKAYHGGEYVSVQLLRTWICPGYTGGFEKICEHPYDKENNSP